MKHAWLVALTVVGCSKSETKDAPAKAEKATEAPAAKAANNDADAKAAEIAARKRVTVVAQPFGLSLSVPEGTTMTPPRDKKPTNVHFETSRDGFMVNVFAVDEFSTQSFAAAQKVYEKDKLVEWFTKEETATGWITYKLVESSLHQRPSYEVDVRTKVGSKAWDCGISSPSKALADLALEACKTLAAN